MTDTIAIKCARCGTFGGPAHWCEARTLPDALPMQRVEPLPVVGYRPAARKLGDPVRDLELLATHLGEVIGSAMDTTPTIPSGRAVDGRADHVDDRHHGLADALLVMRRLASLGELDISVLVMCFLVNGEESRKQWKGGFDSRLGFVMSSREKKLSLITNPIVSASQDYTKATGERLRVDATKAYAEASDDPPSTTGQWISGVIDAVTRKIDEADAILHASIGKGHNRVVSNPKSSNREARRKPLQNKVVNPANVANDSTCANPVNGYADIDGTGAPDGQPTD